MGNEDNKISLDDLIIVWKGRDTLFVDKELYEELQRLPEDSLNRIYATLECDHTNKYKHVWWWLTCNDSRRNDRAHERMLLDYLDGELEIKPRPDEKYKVYWLAGEDQDGDTWYTGLEKEFVLGFETHCMDEVDDAVFTSLTENEINKFQSDTGITLPKSAWHKVTGEKENYE